MPPNLPTPNGADFLTRISIRLALAETVCRETEGAADFLSCADCMDQKGFVRCSTHRRWTNLRLGVALAKWQQATRDE